MEIVEVLKYLLVGLVQGICEVLPISSSAHLMIVQALLGIGEEGLSFEVFLHLASLIAVLFYLRKKLIKLVKGFFCFIFNKEKREENRNNFNYCIYIVISTIPAVVAALVLDDLVAIDSLLIVGILLIVNAVMLYFISKFNKGTKHVSDLKWYNALIIGLFQVAGIVPGISRSGSCLMGTASQKLDKEEAADYAFILFIPAVLGAFVLDLDGISTILSSSYLLAYLGSFIIAGISTYFAFTLLIKIIRKGKIIYFSIYCLIVGAAVIISQLL